MLPPCKINKKKKTPGDSVVHKNMSRGWEMKQIVFQKKSRTLPGRQLIDDRQFDWKKLFCAGQLMFIPRSLQ